jgi:hypothetical protein
VFDVLAERPELGHLSVGDDKLLEHGWRGQYRMLVMTVGGKECPKGLSLRAAAEGNFRRFWDLESQLVQPRFLSGPRAGPALR